MVTTFWSKQIWELILCSKEYFFKWIFTCSSKLAGCKYQFDNMGWWHWILVSHMEDTFELMTHEVIPLPRNKNICHQHEKICSNEVFREKYNKIAMLLNSYAPFFFFSTNEFLRSSKCEYFGGFDNQKCYARMLEFLSVFLDNLFLSFICMFCY